MKYQEWLENWLENYIRPSSKQRTYTRYGEIIRQHIVPSLGWHELEELTPFVLQCFVTELLSSGNLLTGKGLSPNTVNVIISVIQSSLRTAFSLGYLSDYTANKIKRPRAREKLVECFFYVEQKLIETYVINRDNPIHFGIFICLYTGLRIGELLALEWSDVDFVKGELHVNKTCYDGRDRHGTFVRISDTPKTGSSVRTIPLPRQLMPLLRRAKRKSHSIHIVSNGDRPTSVRSYQRIFSSILKQLGIPHKGFHSLRHTFATRALECGMDVKTLSEILGHKNPTVTLTRYAHSLMEHKKEMMNKLGRMI